MTDALSSLSALVEDLTHANTRIGRDELFLGIAHLLRTRSTCLRGKVGAVLVLDKRVIGTGYNGAPAGMPNCFEVGCNVRANDHGPGCIRAIHAEANVISYAARFGVRAEGSSLYCTHGPCLKCAQLLLSAGVRELFYQIPYRLPDGLELLDEGHVLIHQIGV